MRSKSYGAIRAEVKRSHRSEVPAAAKPDWRAQWQTRKDQWVESVWVAMMRDPYRRRYLHYVPTDGAKWGELITVLEGEPAPAGSELVTAEPIVSGNRETIARWLERFVGRLSVIPSEV